MDEYQGGGAIPALADEDLMGEDDDYEDLYNDVNVGEGFLQMHRSQIIGPSSGGNTAIQGQGSNIVEANRREAVVSQEFSGSDKYQNTGSSLPEQKKSYIAVNGPEFNQIDGAFSAHRGTQDAAGGTRAFHGPFPVPQKSGITAPENGEVANSVIAVPGAGLEIPTNQIATSVNSTLTHPVSNANMNRPPLENGPTTLLVGELHWWTTDADLECALSQYGRVKEIKFFEERASGKSKGYCQVDFYDPGAAAACKEGMNGHIFNGRACVVTFASPQTLRQMGASFMNRTQTQPPASTQVRRNVNDGAGRGGGANSYQGGDGGRSYGRSGWGRGQGIQDRGPAGRGPRGTGPMVARGTVGNAAAVGAAGNYGQAIPGPAFGGPAGGMMPPQGMMGPGFDPTFMGRGAGYGGFPGPAFHGMMTPFPSVNPMGFAGVAPHVNPAFFGRGMTPNGMGMMGSNGMDGYPEGMWPDSSMGGWGGEEHDRRTRESSYGGEDGTSEYGYGEDNPEKGAKSNVVSRDKERGSGRDWSGNSERHHRDEREQDWERSDRERRYRDEKDGYRDYRQKERDMDYDDVRDRGQSSASRSRSRAMPEDDHRSRSRDVDYGKRRRAPSE